MSKQDHIKLKTDLALELKTIATHFYEHREVLEATEQKTIRDIHRAVTLMADCLVNGGCLFWCGNGGSAADSQHLAAELVGRFKHDRPPLRSIALTTDSSVLTCVANDYHFEEIFARQITAVGRPGDILVAISTSGKSTNIIKALDAARQRQVTTIGILGSEGGDAASRADLTVIVPSNSTARIQEMHILIGHIICDLLEQHACQTAPMG